MKAILTASLLALLAFPAEAQKADGPSDERWNIGGPAWYETKCGHQGFSVTHGLPYSSWRKPCSVPIRVCEFKHTTISYPADPDVPCEQMIRPLPDGGVVRTYLKRWD